MSISIYVYEVPCNKEYPGWYYVVVYGSYVITENGRTTIVLDGLGTVTFTYHITIITHHIQKSEFGEYCTTLIDPILGAQVNITAYGLVLSSDSSLTNIDPVDTLDMVPNSYKVALISEGSSVVMT